MIWLAESRAQAKVLNLTLEYRVASGCPTATEFKGIVAGRLGYDPFVEDMPDHVLVGVASRGGTLDGRLEWRDATGAWVGEQTFPSVTTDCAHFSRVLGFALAVQIQLLANVRADSVAAVLPPAADPTPPIEPAHSRVTPPPAVSAEPRAATVVPTVTPAPPPSPRPVFALGVGPAMGVGLSSSPVLLGRILGVLAWTHVSLELAAEISVPSMTRREDGAGFSQYHLLAAAAGCAVLAPWNACVVARGGQVRMVGRDIDRPTSATAPVLEAGLRVGAAWHLGGRVSLNPHLDGLSALSRWTGRLDKVPVWTAPRFAAMVGIDAVVRFP